MATAVMVAPSGPSVAGQTQFYLVEACAMEFSDPYDDDNNLSQQEFGGGATGDVPVPPEFLEINGQPLINTGEINTDGSTWGATIISAPAGAPPQFTVGDDSFDGLSDDFTFTNQAFPIHLAIMDTNSGVDLTFQTNTVIVGQQMNFTAQLSVTNSFITSFPLANFQWTVPGITISNYVVADDKSSGIAYTNFPIDNTNVIFYWVDGATNRIVQCSATINSKTIMGQATSDIIKPTINWNGQVTAPVALGTNYFIFPGTLDLHFGGTIIGGTTNFGITCIATNVNLNGYDTNSSAGFLAVQVINNSVITNTGINHLITVLTTNGLDNFYPIMNMGNGNGTIFNDAPSRAFSTNLLQGSESESFRTVLMFLPDEPQVIPVPIKEVDWNWSGDAIFTNGEWTLVSTNAAVTVSDQNTYTYPTWTNLVLNQYF